MNFIIFFHIFVCNRSIDLIYFFSTFQWQVRHSEPMLFHEVGGPQYPEDLCEMPDLKAAASRKKRRLGESMLTEEDAAIACSRVAAYDRDACIFDVLATNDKDLAGSY